MTSRPKVTIGVATFNVEFYLRNAFDDVLAQDFTDFEVVVCDNGSTDDTWTICEEYAARDGRFRIYRNPRNLGLSGNFRRIVELSEGEYFRWTAHDDRMEPTTLSRCVARLDANPDAVLAYPQARLIDEAGEALFDCPGEPDIASRSPARRIGQAMAALVFANAVFGVIRLDALRRTRLLGTLAASDNTLLLELAARGGFSLVRERLFSRRTNQHAPLAGQRVTQERSDWIEPDKAARSPGRKSTNEWPRLSWETARALAVNDLPLATRISTTATFCVVWPLRFARAWAGRWRRRLLSRPSDPRLLAAERAPAKPRAAERVVP
jgi:glycosyltransferase involved in cell wall biosynthesis